MGVLGSCAVDASGNPTQRCGEAASCQPGFACYRGYCLFSGEDGGPLPMLDAGEPDAGAVGPAVDAAAPVQPPSAPPPEPQPAPEPQPTPAPQPEPKPEPSPQPTPAPQPAPKPKPEPAPEPEPTPAPVSDDLLCRFLCEQLGDCTCMGPSGGCTGGRMRCGDKCVDLRTDEKHCGGCNVQCGKRECHEGRCVAKDEKEEDD